MDITSELREVAALLSKNALTAAKATCEAAITKNPGSADAYRLLALVEHRLGNKEQALAAIAGALAINSTDPVSLNVQGVLFVGVGRTAAALDAFARAVEARPTFAPAVLNWGNALLDLNRPSEALECLDRAMVLAPFDAAVALQRGRALQALGRPDEALLGFTRATLLNPKLAGAHLARAELLRLSGRTNEALAAFDAVLSFDPQNKLALQNSATLLHMIGRLDAAVSRYERLIKVLRPNSAFVEQLDYALGMAISCRRTMCAWDGLRELETELIDHVRGGEASIKPHLSLMITDDPHVQGQCARRAWTKQFGHLVARSPITRSRSHDRLRIGYMSGDFRAHPTSWLITGLIERHNRSRFEIYGYSSGPDDRSLLRRRLEVAFDHFVDISGLSDDQAALRISTDEIDILVDLSGPTDFGRGGVIARRPAPVTAHYLAYPGPLGTRDIDYIIADHVVIPPGQGVHFDSAIVRLPGCYQVNDRDREAPSETPTRQAVGLPAEGFVFCGFCQPVKLSPDVFDVWARILTRTPGSVLWLLEDNQHIVANLKREGRMRGIDPTRLVFAPRVDNRAHMARHQAADLFLDTWPCGAHTSASDALWLGVPVVTRPGRTFAGRVAASILMAAELPEFVVDNLQSYEDLAVELAKSTTRLSEVRHRILSTRTQVSLFDTFGFCRNLERAFAEIWIRFETGCTIADFDVAHQ